MAPANIPKRMEKTAASISLLARPQKQQTKIAARKVAVIWTNMGFDHPDFPFAKKGLMRRPNTLVLSQFLSFDCYGDTDEEFMRPLGECQLVYLLWTSGRGRKGDEIPAVCHPAMTGQQCRIGSPFAREIPPATG